MANDAALVASRAVSLRVRPGYAPSEAENFHKSVWRDMRSIRQVLRLEIRSRTSVRRGLFIRFPITVFHLKRLSDEESSVLEDLPGHS